MIKDHTNADVGPDSYHLYEHDISAMKELGVSKAFFFFRKRVSIEKVIIMRYFSSLF